MPTYVIESLFYCEIRHRRVKQIVFMSRDEHEAQAQLQALSDAGKENLTLSLWYNGHRDVLSTR